MQIDKLIKERIVYINHSIATNLDLMKKFNQQRCKLINIVITTNNQSLIIGH